MADKKITQLTNITGADLVDADEFVVVDISADETKAITLGELKEAFDSGSGFVRITGDTMTGDLELSGADVTFGDNDKAIFGGTTSELQIYSDGSYSYIDEVGTNDLVIRGGNNIWIQRADGTETLAKFTTDGACEFRYDNGVKLATTSTGVDVTGKVFADEISTEYAGKIGFNTSDSFTLNGQDTPQYGMGRTSIAQPMGISGYYGLAFASSGTEAMRIDSSGNLLVGTADPLVGSGTGNNTEGLALSAGSYGGYATFSRSGSECLNLNRKTNDGTILNFRKDGTTVGSIQADAGMVTIGTGTTNLNFRTDGSNPRVIPRAGAGSASNGLIDLGDTGSRFKDLYLSGGVYLGGTGSANKLDDYEEGTWTAQLSDGTNISSTTATGYYTKVGRIVHCMVAKFTNISTSGMSGALRLSLPFTPSSGGFYSSGTAVMFSGSFPSNTYALRASIYHGETLGYLQAVGTSGAASLSTSNITSGTTDIDQITFSYIT
jgi:hypothetical protein